ncbi:MAG: glycosyltransferase family 2 protein [Ignavibacteriales bacterium]|nr:glycosyltransferase family 2 protein [Ignavibacteriales bacterium]
MTDISIVLITWKMKSLLERLLISLYKYSEGFDFELIIIDNNSQDGTVEMIEEKYQNTILIKNKENLGVAPARNQGLKIAKGKYILILDADMELTENSLLQLFQFMERDKECGLVGCKLTDVNGTLQYSCKKFPSIFSLFARRLEGFSLIRNSKLLNEHLMTEWNHNEIGEVDYVIGACQFFRRDVMEKIGYYDDKIFYGPEDIDYCIRVWEAAWKVKYYPFTSIIHHEQRITKKALFSKITLKHLVGIYYIFNKYNGKLTR